MVTITTPKPQKKAVTNYLVPISGGTHAMKFEQDFTEPLTIDWAQQNIDGLGFQPSGFYCDNFTGSDPITVTVNELNFTVIIDAGKSLCYQYPGPVDHTVTISGADSAVIIFVDFPVIPFQLTAPGP